MGLVRSKPFFRQPSIAKAPVFQFEELGNDDFNDSLICLGVRSDAAVDPSAVGRQRASRRHPGEAQQAIVSAVLSKRQVRGLRFEVCREHREIWKAHSFFPANSICIRATQVSNRVLPTSEAHRAASAKISEPVKRITGQPAVSSSRSRALPRRACSLVFS